MFDTGKKDTGLNQYGDNQFVVRYKKEKDGWTVEVVNRTNNTSVHFEKRKVKGFGRIRVYVKKLWRKFAESTVVAVVRLGKMKPRVIGFDYYDSYKIWRKSAMNYDVLTAWDPYGLPIDLGIEA